MGGGRGAYRRSFDLGLRPLRTRFWRTRFWRTRLPRLGFGGRRGRGGTRPRAEGPRERLNELFFRQRPPCDAQPFGQCAQFPHRPSAEVGRRCLRRCRDQGTYPPSVVSFAVPHATRRPPIVRRVSSRASNAARSTYERTARDDSVSVGCGGGNRKIRLGEWPATTGGRAQRPAPPHIYLSGVEWNLGRQRLRGSSPGAGFTRTPYTCQFSSTRKITQRRNHPRGGCVMADRLVRAAHARRDNSPHARRSPGERRRLIENRV